MTDTSTKKSYISTIQPISQPSIFDNFQINHQSTISTREYPNNFIHHQNSTQLSDKNLIEKHITPNYSSNKIIENGFINVPLGDPTPNKLTSQYITQGNPMNDEYQFITETRKVLPDKILLENLDDINEISPAIAMTDSELAYYHIVIHILQSHKKLTTEDIQYAANYIISFYSHNYDTTNFISNHTADDFYWGSVDNLEGYNIKSSRSNVELMSSERNDINMCGNNNILNIKNLIHSNQTSVGLDDQQLIMFLVYADQKGIAKFALIFNEELDEAIKNKDTISLKKLLLGPKEMFIELYDNPYLSYEDREFIIRLISREMFAMTLTFESIKKNILDEFSLDYYQLNSFEIDENLNKEIYNNSAGLHGNLEFLNTTHDFCKTTKSQGICGKIGNFAAQCYDKVCIQDAEILEDDKVRAEMSKYEKPSDSVFTIDKSYTASTPQVYCFNTLDLIKIMTENTPFNPKSNEPFSEYALNLITQRFRKEIAMYKRFKEIKTSKNIS